MNLQAISYDLNLSEQEKCEIELLLDEWNSEEEEEEEEA